MMPRGQQPSVLFHGTPLAGLQELQPAPGRVLYASDDMRLSSTFLADPEHCVCARSFRGDVHALIGERREAFVRRDRGGTIYLVDASQFSLSPPDGGRGRGWEWTTTDAITPIGSVVYTSALTAMMALGVRVYFVAREFCENLRSDADTEAAIARYPCENDRFERYLYNARIGFHSGPGGLASGILPVARSTGRVCLAWRSGHVHLGNCWGTIGGAAHSGVSLAESARRELREETGYEGPIELHPAYVFALTDFSYHNFIGVVPSEFALVANEHHAWETMRLRWVELPQLMAELERTPREFHLGLRRLIVREQRLIARLSQSAETAAAG